MSSEIKICGRCGRALPLENYRLKKSGSAKMYYSNICRECEKAYSYEYGERKRAKNRIVLNPDVEIRFQRKFKEIEKQRILDVAHTGIPLIGTDEVFVKLMDYKDAYLSNYGRCISVARNGKYYLLKGNHSGINYSYTLKRIIFENGVWKERSEHCYVAQLVIDNFMHNHDKEHNVYIWHAGYDQDDFYYKNLYPLNEQQYYAVRKYYRENGVDPEEVILNIMNDFKYQHEDYREKDYKPTICGVGYAGCADADRDSRCYKVWRDMIYRCYGDKAPEGYEDCTVSEEWLSYANFRVWYKAHYYSIPDVQMDIDKDLLIHGNRVYSAATCCIVPHFINCLVVYNKSNCGDLPAGVYYDNYKKKFRAESNFMGKQKKLGDYRTADEATHAYKIYKEKLLKDMAVKNSKYLPYNVFRALVEWEV